jgi:hypothetical protein
MNVMEIWEPKPPGTFWVTPGCYATALLSLTRYICLETITANKTWPFPAGSAAILTSFSYKIKFQKDKSGKSLDIRGNLPCTVAEEETDRFSDVILNDTECLGLLM